MTDAIRLEVTVAASAGRARSTVADAWVAIRCPTVDAGETAAVLAVADGGSAACGGDTASLMIASTTRLELLDWIGDGLVHGRAAWLEGMRDVFGGAADELRRLVRFFPARAAMRTTLTCIVVEGNQLICGHVGRSRAYLFRDGILLQLTTDHTVAADLVTDGRLSPADAATHPSRQVLTRWLSARSIEEPDVDSLPVAPGDIVLVCSDGLHDVVPPDQIAAILAATPRADDDRPFDPVAMALVERAEANGGGDDITVVLAACLPS